jgi:hypothetical protein
LFAPDELAVPARRVVLVGMASAPAKAVAATKRVVKDTMMCLVDEDDELKDGELKDGEYRTLASEGKSRMR